MNTQESTATKFCQYDEPYLQDKKKYELLCNLKSADVGISVVKGKRVGDLHDISCKKLITVTKRIRN